MHVPVLDGVVALEAEDVHVGPVGAAGHSRRVCSTMESPSAGIRAKWMCRPGYSRAIGSKHTVDPLLPPGAIAAGHLGA